MMLTAEVYLGPRLRTAQRQALLTGRYERPRCRKESRDLARPVEATTTTTAKHGLK